MNGAISVLAEEIIRGDVGRGDEGCVVRQRELSDLMIADVKGASEALTLVEA